MKLQTVGAIAFCPTRNSQGGYFFFSLNVGRQINRNRWTVLPMPDDMINQVHQLACSDPLGIVDVNHSGSELLHAPSPEEIKSHGDDNENDTTYQPGQHDDEDGDDDSLPSIHEVPMDNSMGGNDTSYLQEESTAIMTADTSPNENIHNGNNDNIDHHGSVISTTGVNEDRNTTGVHNEDANTAGVHHEEEEYLVQHDAEDLLLQTEFNNREVQVNVRLPGVQNISGENNTDVTTKNPPSSMTKMPQ
eukprot:2895099-Ditylum_brightwellii.AAC.1